jgi:hypothetical protein
MTNEEKQKIYAALAKPFDEHCIQRIEGRLTGRGYETTGIGYQFIANRLNEVLGVGGWRAHRVVTLKEVTLTLSNSPPALEPLTISPRTRILPGSMLRLLVDLLPTLLSAMRYRSLCADNVARPGAGYNHSLCVT